MTAQSTSFLLFALVASITPGPTNVVMLESGMSRGLLRSLPVILGASIGSAALVLLAGLGAGRWLGAHPGLRTGLAFVGALWLACLAWQLARSSGEIDPAGGRRPAGAVSGALLQIVNPKTWAMAIAVLGLFAGPGAGPARYMILSATFCIVAIPCLLLWATMGAQLKVHPLTPATMRRVNVILALVLAGSGVIGMAETLGPFA